jgi:hypothetical protein
MLWTAKPMRRGRLESCYLNHNEPEKVIGLNPL